MTHEPEFYLRYDGIQTTMGVVCTPALCLTIDFWHAPHRGFINIVDQSSDYIVSLFRHHLFQTSWINFQTFLTPDEHGQLIAILERDCPLFFPAVVLPVAFRHILFKIIRATT